MRYHDFSQSNGVVGLIAVAALGGQFLRQHRQRNRLGISGKKELIGQSGSPFPVKKSGWWDGSPLRIAGR